jgi:hypothetical protein
MLAIGNSNVKFIVSIGKNWICGRLFGLVLLKYFGLGLRPPRPLDSLQTLRSTASHLTLLSVLTNAPFTPELGTT